MGPSYSYSVIFFRAYLLLSILSPFFLPSSVSLSYFIFENSLLSYFILECSRKHSYMSSSFPIAIMNCTCFFARRNSPMFTASSIASLPFLQCSLQSLAASGGAGRPVLAYVEDLQLGEGRLQSQLREALQQAAWRSAVSHYTTAYRVHIQCTCKILTVLCSFYN